MSDATDRAKPEIRLYDSATREKQVLRPLDPTNVRMYVCGPTVYDRAHIGNARPVVVFDVLHRLLRHVYGPDAVTYVRNITDVDDKINKRAAESRGEGESTLDAIRRITGETIGWYHDDMAALGALKPTHEPRATEYVPGMIAMIEALIERGCAYEAEGHVLFDVSSWPAYGSLSRRPLDEMEAGARVEVAPYKRSPLDFVLWKPSDESLPGWDSPWGRGRPGWHVECSAMAKALLGERFDVHGGGIDLQFPHHENELAQSCCANGTERMASIWMHNGYLTVEGEKMSKSAGNFFSVRDLLDRGIPGEVIRFVLLSTRYTEPLDWTDKKVEEATTLLRSWFRFKRQAKEIGFSVDGFADEPDRRVIKALSDDLNTPKVRAVLSEMSEEAKLEKNPASEVVARFFGTLEWLGLPVENPDAGAIRKAVERGFEEVEVAETIERLLADRQAARKSKDFARADAIRATLDRAGVLVMDRPNAPTDWELSPHFDPAKLETAR